MESVIGGRRKKAMKSKWTKWEGFWAVKTLVKNKSQVKKAGTREHLSRVLWTLWPSGTDYCGHISCTLNVYWVPWQLHLTLTSDYELRHKNMKYLFWARWPWLLNFGTFFNTVCFPCQDMFQWLNFQLLIKLSSFLSWCLRACELKVFFERFL